MGNGYRSTYQGAGEKMKKTHIAVCALLIMAAVIATLMVYPAMPASIPVHWGGDGQPDGYGPRAILWLLGPGTMLFGLGLGLCLPWLSPQRYAVETFKATYSYFMLVLVCMFGLIYAAILHAITSGDADIVATIHLCVFVLLILLGNSMGKVRRNFFIGIRTPWTLASERVWYATHRISARLMVASGLAGVAAVYFRAPAGIMMVIATAWALIAVLYSLVYYKRLEGAGQLDAG